jgi:hypothetical protein
MVAKALSAAAWKTGHYDLAVLLLVGFCFFLRTMEFVMLRRENVVVDLPSSQIVVTLERTKTSKQFQQSLVLRRKSLAIILSKAFRFLPANGPIWQSSARSFRQCFTRLLAHFELEPYGFSPYSICRGGATHVYVASRDLHFVTLQGRWKDIRTSRIYLDDARATGEALFYPSPFPPPLTVCRLVVSFQVAPPKASVGLIGIGMLAASHCGGDSCLPAGKMGTPFWEVSLLRSQ